MKKNVLSIVTPEVISVFYQVQHLNTSTQGGDDYFYAVSAMLPELADAEAIYEKTASSRRIVKTTREVVR